MNNTVKMLTFMSMCDIAAMESFFEDMSARGLHLKKIGTVFTYFERGQPSDMIYRIDLLSGNPDSEQLEVYQQCGWRFVMHTGVFYVFRAPRSDSLVELHTDPAEQSKSIKEHRRLILASCFMALGVLLSLLATLPMLFRNGTPLLNMVTSSAANPLFTAAMLLLNLVLTTREWLPLYRLKKSLARGVSMEHRVNWRRKRAFQRTLLIFILALSLLSIIVPTLEMVSTRNHTMPDELDYTVVRLERIESDPALRRVTYSTVNGVDWGNRVSSSMSLPAPLRIETSQSLEADPELYPDRLSRYRPSISSRSYTVLFSALEAPLYSDLVKEKEKTNEDIFTGDVRIISHITDHRFDRLCVVERPYFNDHERGILSYSVIAQSGRRLICAEYNGRAEPQAVIDEIAAVMLTNCSAD